MILGKTNLSEWANFRSTHSSSGWSGRGGQCRNPTRSTATRPGRAPARARPRRRTSARRAIGTETDGSIVSPSNNCSLVGIKPTLGLASRVGHHPDRAQPGHAGPDVPHRRGRRAAPLGDHGDGSRRPGDAGRDGKAAPDYTKFLDPKGLEGARIGVPRKGLYGQSAPPTAWSRRRSPT